MDLIAVKCPLCDHLIRLVNCPHTYPDCPWRSPLMPLGWILPVTHDTIPTVSEDKLSDTATRASATAVKVEKTAKSDETATDQKLREAQMNGNQVKFHLSPQFHRCPMKTDHTAELAAHKRFVSLLNSTGSAEFTIEPTRVKRYKSNAGQIHNASDTEANQEANSLTNTSSQHVNSTENPLKLVATVDDAGKQNDPVYIGNESAKDVEPDISVTNKTLPTGTPDELESRRGVAVVKEICLAISNNLDHLDTYGAMEKRWNCLTEICGKSLRNQQTFLNAGGTKLFHQRYKKFNSQTYLIYTMIDLMLQLSKEETLRQNLMSNGNLQFLWQIWREAKEGSIERLTIYKCSQIFTNFLSVVSADWPLGRPTIGEVKKQLKEEGKRWQEEIRLRGAQRQLSKQNSRVKRYDNVG